MGFLMLLYWPVCLRLLYADTCITIDLVLSKCKVAPLERRTIPGMELEGAVILSKLLEVAACDLNIPTTAIYAWTDSTIVLGWLNKPLSELKGYVAHRVEKITARVKKDQWRYLNTSCNPADILSRGIHPKDLLQMKTCWKGPPWLQLSPQDWPRRPDINFNRELPDLRKTVLLVPLPEEEFGIKFSSYVRLLRVFAWIRRFCEKARKLNKVPFPDYLTVLQLCTARNALFVVSQKFTYCHERLILMKNKQLSTSHPMGSLSPYLDSRGIMRVGGRLQKAGLGYDSTHPILLSIKSHIIKLLIDIPIAHVCMQDLLQSWL